MHYDDKNDVAVVDKNTMSIAYFSYDDLVVLQVWRCLCQNKSKIGSLDRTGRAKIVTARFHFSK